MYVDIRGVSWPGVISASRGLGCGTSLALNKYGQSEGGTNPFLFVVVWTLCIQPGVSMSTGDPCQSQRWSKKRNWPCLEKPSCLSWGPMDREALAGSHSWERGRVIDSGSDSLLFLLEHLLISTVASRHSQIWSLSAWVTYFHSTELQWKLLSYSTINAFWRKVKVFRKFS